MSYVMKRRAIEPVGTLGAQSLASTGVLALSYAIGSESALTRVGFIVSTAPTVTAPVVQVYQRVTYGSDTNRVLLGTITLPVGTAIGKVVYKDFSNPLLLPGQQLIFNVATAGSAGAGVPVLEIADSPEVAANQSNMIASA